MSSLLTIKGNIKVDYVVNQLDTEKVHYVKFINDKYTESGYASIDLVTSIIQTYGLDNIRFETHANKR